MTYIELINDFWRYFENEAMKPNDALLYLYLLNVCNSKAWENPFELSNKKVKNTLGMTDKSIIESRERLIKRGFIWVTKGDRNSTKPKYKLTRLCFPTESKKESKTGSNLESKIGINNAAKMEAERKQTESKTESIYKDIDLEYYLVAENITRAGFYDDFFSPERQGINEQLCLARGFGTIENFKRLADAVLAEWEALPEPKHRDLKEARQHLINHCSRKMSAERRDKQISPTQNPITDGTRISDPAPTKQERTEVFANHILDKLTRPDTPEFDDGFD